VFTCRCTHHRIEEGITVESFRFPIA